ncbi:MAG: HlyD family efflux transporter periplasmic adaptor subunit, partial [Chitinophagia bacterium]|nr:HlyD family efflux transporter periplasmic adaptor subunit [Chitinophagia bacterium]
AAEKQIAALNSGLTLKLEQLRNKIVQLQLKVQADSAEAIAAQNDLNIGKLQFDRQRVLFDSGLVSLTQVEQRNQTYQSALAKKISADNRLANTRQELTITMIEMNAQLQENREKVAKAEGDRFQSLTEIASGQVDVAKLRNLYASYSIRNGMYYILAPQAGQVISARKAGIGEYVKEGEMIVEIVPEKFVYAVEMFVRPLDVPLMAPGQKVRFLFDGFPAIVFSGWPNASYGTFGGVIVAVERNISQEGKFRILIKEDPNDKPWKMYPSGMNSGETSTDFRPITISRSNPLRIKPTNLLPHDALCVPLFTGVSKLAGDIIFYTAGLCTTNQCCQSPADEYSQYNGRWR